jgi:hypothetical protein
VAGMQRTHRATMSSEASCSACWRHQSSGATASLLSASRRAAGRPPAP